MNSPSTALRTFAASSIVKSLGLRSSPSLFESWSTTAAGGLSGGVAVASEAASTASAPSGWSRMSGTYRSERVRYLVALSNAWSKRTSAYASSTTKGSPCLAASPAKPSPNGTSSKALPRLVLAIVQSFEPSTSHAVTRSAPVTSLVSFSNGFSRACAAFELKAPCNPSRETPSIGMSHSRFSASSLYLKRAYVSLRMSLRISAAIVSNISGS
mmetsp:Transcript_571/g.1510  ORF Transcript_571/g.1510 Transcript_571/m.1510 type:complete len:213 (-) Transcript_571:551-1189(-)